MTAPEPRPGAPAAGPSPDPNVDVSGSAGSAPHAVPPADKPRGRGGKRRHRDGSGTGQGGGGGGGQGGDKLYSGRRFRKSLGHFAVGRTAQAVATVAFTIAAVRLLEPLEYGAYMVLWGLIELGRPLSSLGLLPALQQYVPELALRGTKAQLMSFVRWAMAGRFLLLGLFAGSLYLFWVPVSGWLGFQAGQVQHVWIACAMIVTVLGAQFTEQMLESLLEQRIAGVIRALWPLGRLAGLVALWLAGQATLLNMLIVDLAVSALCLVLSEYWLHRQLRNVHPDGSKHFERAEILRFIGHMSVSQLFNTVANAGTLRLLVSRLLGLEVAGQFAFFQQLVTQIKRFLPSVMLAGVVRPMLISRHLEGDAASVATAAGMLWKINLMVIWPIVVLMAVSGDWVVAQITGGRIADGGIPMAWMMLGAASIAQGQIINMMMQVYRHSEMVTVNSLVSFSAPLLVAAGSVFGLAGVAAGLAATLWLRSSVGLYLLRRKALGMTIDWNGAARIGAVLTIAGGAGWAATHYGAAPLGAATVAVVYAAGVALVRPFAATEFTLLMRALGGRVRRLALLARST